MQRLRQDQAIVIWWSRADADRLAQTELLRGALSVCLKDSNRRRVSCVSCAANDAAPQHMQAQNCAFSLHCTGADRMADPAAATEDVAAEETPATATAAATEPKEKDASAAVIPAVPAEPAMSAAEAQERLKVLAKNSRPNLVSLELKTLLSCNRVLPPCGSWDRYLIGCSCNETVRLGFAGRASC